MKKIYRAIYVWIAFGVVVGLCPAPIPDPRPTPPPVPEQTQEQLAAQQRFNGVQGEVGKVQIVESSAKVDGTAPSSEAARDLRTSDNQLADPNAKENLKVAEEALKGAKGSPVKSFLVGLTVLLVAVAGVVGFRMWADKNIPVPVTPKTKTRW